MVCALKDEIEISVSRADRPHSWIPIVSVQAASAARGSTLSVSGCTRRVRQEIVAWWPSCSGEEKTNVLGSSWTVVSVAILSGHVTLAGHSVAECRIGGYSFIHGVRQLFLSMQEWFSIAFAAHARSRRSHVPTAFNMSCSVLPRPRCWPGVPLTGNSGWRTSADPTSLFASARVSLPQIVSTGMSRRGLPLPATGHHLAL